MYRALRNTNDGGTVRISLLFQDVAGNAVLEQLRDRSHKIGVTVQPFFLSKKLGQDLKPKVVNQQRVVYYFKCDLCDSD